MATVVLTAAGSAVGGLLGVPNLGAQVGNVFGGAIDRQLFGDERNRVIGPRLSDLAVQTSTYGKVIPIVYGTARIAGNVIWSLPIKETANTSSAGGKGGGGARVTTTSFSYSVSLAIAVAEGPIDKILRVWADAKLLDLSQGSYRFYQGTEEQNPDPFIEGFEGVDKTPAYRGLAYVVIEDFPLADYGNRIPNFTFEVRRRIKPIDVDGQSVEDMIKSVIMIPGSGEFVYDTQIQHKVGGVDTGSGFVQAGVRQRINCHNHEGLPNAVLALDQLQEDLPNVEWVGVVVTWFGNSLYAGDCLILPGVEYASGALTEPDTWSVGAFTRGTAHAITLDANGSPIYGGTPDDGALLRYLDELSARNIKVMFYPMFFMDVEDKPWRGRVTGTASEVGDFFTKTNGYNAFITHYANLVADKVDAFVIGSELIGLTKVMHTTPGVFPAVDKLVDLAATVKGVLGSDVVVTYAADWSEYHHTDGGWYNLDPLWASDNIDVVGIDAYFPLTDIPQNGYDLQAVMDGWNSGEGYDFYYSDPERTSQAPLSAAYAWKNIAWWWNNSHVNPDASTTDWVPGSKKIWFTEYGFPSVDGATNQPNVFYDPNSSEGALPRFSRGRIDFGAQRMGLAATEKVWEANDIVERRFVWTWDARPFPFWPDLTQIWADGPLWRYGHWINGKLGISGLGGIIQDLAVRAGMEVDLIDVSALIQLVEGFVLTHRVTAREAMELLRKAYFFDMAETDGVLRFLPRGRECVAEITEDFLVQQDARKPAEVIELQRLQEVELPQKVDVVYLSRVLDYQPGTQSAQRETVNSPQAMTLNLPIVMSDQYARVVADIALYTAWTERMRYRFAVPLSQAVLEPADVLEITAGNATHRIRVMRSSYGRPGLMEIEGVAEELSLADFYAPPGDRSGTGSEVIALPDTALALLDLPALPGEDVNSARLHIAMVGKDEGWRGSVLYRTEDETEWQMVATVEDAALMGAAATVLSDGPSYVVDEVNTVDVVLLGNGELASAASEIALLNGANSTLLGEEIIQFRTATLLSPGHYRLSGLLRGRLGTEYAMSTHQAGEVFVLLDARVMPVAIGDGLVSLPRIYKAVTLGSTLGATPDSTNFSFSAKALKPLSPVHVAGTRSSGDITINWVRRTRGGGPWKDNVDVPLNERTEAYEVDILNVVNVVRTLSGLTSPQASYSSAEQTIDFGGPQASVSVRVYQLSEAVGRGWAGIAVI